MGSKQESSMALSDFESTEKGIVTSCPQGYEAIKTKKKKARHTVAFDSQH